MLVENDLRSRSGKFPNIMDRLGYLDLGLGKTMKQKNVFLRSLPVYLNHPSPLSSHALSLHEN